MKTEIKLSLWQGRIRIHSDSKIDELMQAIPGAKQVEKLRVWHMPYSPYSLWRLYNHEGLTVTKVHDSLSQLENEAASLFNRAQYKTLETTKRDELRIKFNTKTVPWDHQVDASEYIKDRDCAYLAMDMGTGKSLVAINDILRTGAMRILIMCPKSVIPVWPSEFKIHSSRSVTSAILNKGTTKVKVAYAKQVQKLAEALKQPFMVIVNYETAWRDSMKSYLKGVEWDYIVYDEAHKIKSAKGRASNLCKSLVSNSKKRLALSGTPFPNDKRDAYGQCRALDPGIFGTVKTTMWNRYAQMAVWNEHVVQEWKNSEEFNELMNILMFRVGQEVLNLLPPTHQYVEVPLSAKARKMYKEMMSELVAEAKVGEYVVAKNVLAKLVRLAQISSGVVTPVDEDGEKLPPVVIDRGKRDALRDVLEGINKNEKVVVFCRFRHELESVKDITNDLGRRYKELSGTRKDLEGDRFPSDGDILGVQLQSGGVGVNLSDAAYCVYFSLTFNLADYLQSLARTHRGGQTRSVSYVHILAEESIDGLIYKALQEKKEVIDVIVEYIKNGGK